jgi:hypothetical protein
MPKIFKLSSEFSKMKDPDGQTDTICPLTVRFIRKERVTITHFRLCV